MEGSKSGEARSALSKFEAKADGFAMGFGEIGIGETMITKVNVYRRTGRKVVKGNENFVPRAEQGQKRKCCQLIFMHLKE